MGAALLLLACGTAEEPDPNVTTRGAAGSKPTGRAGGGGSAGQPGAGGRQGGAAGMVGTAGSAGKGGSSGATTNAGSGGATTHAGNGGATTNAGNGGATTHAGNGGATTHAGNGGATTHAGNGGSPSAGAGGGVSVCAGKADGAFCKGNERVECSAGAELSRTACPDGCAVLPRDGKAACLSDATEPCFNDADRAYCGGAIGSQTDQGALFVCKDKRTVSVTPCPTGCGFVAASGQDACLSNEVDPCFDDAANGYYCGESNGGVPGTLYECRDKVTKSQQVCALGCQAMPFGTPDRCKQPATACIDRPPGAFVRGFSACGNGGSHYGIDYGSKLGTNLPSGVAGTVVSVATGNPNCPYNDATGTCPSSCINQFNYIKIRADGGDPANGANDLFVYYLHVDGLAPGIGNGVHVDKGTLLGYVGNSGCSSGPHAHLETVSVAKGANAFLQTCSSVDPASRMCP